MCVCVKNTSYSQKKKEKKKPFLANILNISKIESFEIYQDICIPTRWKLKAYYVKLTIT